MQQRQIQPTSSAFKLSGDNSTITFFNGKEYQIEIESALRELIGNLPEDFNLRELHDKVFMIKDHIEENIPDDMNIKAYKYYCKHLNAFAHFFGALFVEMKGGNND